MNEVATASRLVQEKADAIGLRFPAHRPSQNSLEYRLTFLLEHLDRLTAPSPGNREIAERIVAEYIPQPASHEVSHPRLTDAITDALNSLSAERDAEIEYWKQKQDRWEEAARDECTRAERAEALLEKAMEAVTPSAETKAAYMGEFRFQYRAGVDEYGNDLIFDNVQVPWTTIKEIMAAIKARATLSEITLEK